MKSSLKLLVCGKKLVYCGHKLTILWPQFSILCTNISISIYNLPFNLCLDRHVFYIIISTFNCGHKVLIFALKIQIFGQKNILCAH